MPQTLADISHEQVPIDVTLVLSEFPIGRRPEQDTSLAAAEETRKLLTPTDRLRIVWIRDDVQGEVMASSDRLDTDARTRALVLGTGLANGYRLTVPPDVDRFGFGNSLADGLFYALAWPVDADRRHLVVAFTDGRDLTSTLEMKTLPQLAAHSDAVLHAVFWTTPSDGGPSRSAWEADYQQLDAAVLRTGGTLQRASRAAEALAAIFGDFRSSYVLRYTPRGVERAGWHELNVKVTRRGSFTVRARKGWEG